MELLDSTRTLRHWRGAESFKRGVNPSVSSLLDDDHNCPYSRWVRYEWDPAKAAANLAEHGVSLTEAVTALEDDFALTREAPGSQGEQRFITLDMSGSADLLVVVYAYREPNIIRLISAWKANRRQSLRYEKDRR